MYHFGDNGIAHVTETVDTRTCTTNGYYLTTCKDCGASYRGATIWYEGHSWDENHVCTKCGTKGKNIADAEVRTASVVFGGKKAICNVTVTYQGKKLTVKTSDVNVDGYIYYTNNTSGRPRHRHDQGHARFLRHCVPPSIRSCPAASGTLPRPRSARSRSASSGRRPPVRKTTASR